ncbi:Uncharacterised protein [Vibrio cholerae]|nr:hypothetical protein VCSRO100_2296 [Vibrio cholerae]GIB78884.1 hypothetical protein VCSRO94_3560 [Vibrio cholerae]SNC57364.1 Uncharacterised protein [Vibrio cholerae]
MNLNCVLVVMNNLLFAYSTILLIWFGVSGDSIASENCDDTSGVHQKILVCIQNEIAKSETQIRNNISSKSIDYGFPDDFYSKQRSAIHEKCILYINVDGQRGELLMNQCELSMLQSLDIFIQQYIEDVDNS